MSRAGFTLIELMLVTALLGLMLALAAPAFQGAYSALALEDAARSLGLTLDYARERAVLDGRNWRVDLDPDEGLYRLAEERDGMFRPAEGHLGRARRLPRGVTLEAPSRELPFLPNGSGVDAEIVLKDGRGRSFRVRVDGVTGAVAETRDEG